MAGDIEAFLKMAAERRRKALEAEGKASSPPPPQDSGDSRRAQYQSSRPAARPAPPPPPRPQANVPYNQPRQRPQQRTSPAPPAPKSPVPPIRPLPPVELVEAVPLDTDDPYYQEDQASESDLMMGNGLVSSEVSSLDISDHAEHLDDSWNDSVTDDRPKKPKKATMAEELVKMLTQPDSVSKAVVLNEILKRPDYD